MEDSEHMSAAEPVHSQMMFAVLALQKRVEAQLLAAVRVNRMVGETPVHQEKIVVAERVCVSHNQ